MRESFLATLISLKKEIGVNKNASLCVVISVYKKDKPDHLAQSLESISAKQTRKPNKIILIIDGQISNNLMHVINTWYDLNKDSIFIRIEKNSINLGLTKSLNKAIKLCTCDYIARMDSDDISISERFALQINYLENNKDIDVLGGYIQEIDSNNKSLNIRTFPNSNSSVLKQIPISSPVNHPSVMFRRKIFDEGNYYNEKYKTSQDIAFWFYLLSKGYRISNLDRIITLFRLNENMVKRRSYKKGVTEFFIYFKGILDLYGFSYKLVYPFLRLFTRLMPSPIIKLIYFSGLRKILNNNK